MLIIHNLFVQFRLRIQRKKKVIFQNLGIYSSVWREAVGIIQAGRKALLSYYFFPMLLQLWVHSVSLSKEKVALDFIALIGGWSCNLTFSLQCAAAFVLQLFLAISRSKSLLQLVAALGIVAIPTRGHCKMFPIMQPC